MTGLAQTSSEATRSRSLPSLIVSRDSSAIRPELAFSGAEHSLPYSDVTIYIFATSYLSAMLYVKSISMTSPLGVAVGLMSI